METQLITDLWQVLSMLPLFITEFTDVVKSRLPKNSKMTKLVPYVISSLFMLSFYFIYGGGSKGIFLVSWFAYTIGSVRAYDKGKQEGVKEGENTLDK